MASIPLPALHAQAPQQPESPISQLAKIQQLKSMQGQQALQQQALQEGQLQTQQQQQAMKDQEAFRAAMSDPSMQGKTLGEVADSLAKSGNMSPATWQQMKKADIDQRKQLADLDEATLKNYKASHDATQNLYSNVMNMSEQQIAQNWGQIAQQYDSIPGNQKMPLDPNQPMSKAQLQQFGPFMGMQNAYLDQELARREKGAEATMKTQDAQLSPIDRALKNQSALEYYAAKGDPTAQAALQKKIEVAKASRPVNNLMTNSDAGAIADAIESGDQPPTLQGLYRNAAPVRAELAKRGVPLAKMEMDWNATKKYVGTLNGSQQVRLRQAITTAYDSLDKIEGLYNEWQQLAPTSGFKILNKASLAASKNLPGRTGAVAQALDAQIADLTSELGNVYMGGNSPTDHALGLAKQNLSADWNADTFKEALKQARANLQIRKNSILNTEVAGASADNTYAPKQVGQPAQSTGKVVRYKIVNGQLVPE